MPRVCAAVNCTSGYARHATPENVTFHKFPSKENYPNLFNTWVKVLNREGFEPKYHHCLCSLHFSDDDFKATSVDTNERRKQRRELGQQLLRRYLKPYAVPRNFNYPEYLTAKRTPEKRKATEKATAEARRVSSEIRHEEMNQEFLDSDKLSCLDDIEMQLKNDPVVPEGFSFIRKEEQLFVAFLEINKAKIPVMEACLVIEPSLHFALSIHGKSVDKSNLSDFKDQTFERYSEVIHCMTLMKKWL